MLKQYVNAHGLAQINDRVCCFHLTDVFVVSKESCSKFIKTSLNSLECVHIYMSVLWCGRARGGGGYLLDSTALQPVL